jgi:hypothetical protein
MEIVTSFLLGFISMWFVLRLDIMKPSKVQIKDTMIEMATQYGNNQKICKELKDYSIKQIKNGNYEYVEVIDTLKRQNNDKTRT